MIGDFILALTSCPCSCFSVMKTKCFISNWKLEEQMLLNIFDWIMQFATQIRTHTAIYIYARAFGKIGQIVCIQSHVLLAICQIISSDDTFEQLADWDTLKLHCW